MKRTLFIALACFTITQASAQILDSLEVSSVEWIFPGTRGEVKSQEFQQLMTDFKFGKFLSTPSQSYNWSGSFRNSTMGFAFKVVSGKAKYEKHSVLLALHKQVVNIDWYTGENDSLSLDLSGRYEYFQLGLGYDFGSINTKFLKLLSGLRLDMGLPVSGFQTETNVEESKFFSEGSVSFTATANLVLELRLFKRTYFKIGPSWAVGFYDFDGLSIWIPQSGLILGFKFGL